MLGWIQNVALGGGDAATPDMVSVTLTITQTATALTQVIEQSNAQDRTIVQSIPLTMER